MLATKEIDLTNFNGPVNLLNKDFINNKWAYYRWLRENSPVHRGRLSVVPLTLLSRYDDCVSILKDPRIVRNRSTATGKGGRLPFPLPKSVQMLVGSMINEDEPGHRRLRNLVHKAFTPKNLAYLDQRIETLTHELLDQAEAKGEFDLMKDYALPIPVTVIGEMVGVEPGEVPEFAQYITALSSGFSGMSLFRTFIWDLPKAINFSKDLIERKRANPGDDILTALIQAEEDGDKLSEDELVAMLFLLIIAGYETTVHLITNGVQTFLTHPDQFQQLKENWDLIDSAVEEINRFNGPIQGTKLGYPTEDMTIRGVTVKKGTSIMPLLGAGNFDPDAFENPDLFDIERTPNRHLGFGQGIHYCLGAPLARMETRAALRNLFQRYPDIRLAIDPSELKIQRIPGWHRYQSLPVRLK